MLANSRVRDANIGMVTISDLTWDDERLLELFWILDPAGRDAVMTHAAILACAPTQDQPGATRRAADQPPEAVALAILRKCRPPLPCGWVSDTGFGSEVEQAVCSRIGRRAIDMVLTTSDNDGANAEALVALAVEEAARIGPGFCAPSFEEGYVAMESMRQFIEDWRDAFDVALRDQHARATGASRKSA